MAPARSSTALDAADPGPPSQKDNGSRQVEHSSCREIHGLTWRRPPPWPHDALAGRERRPRACARSPAPATVPPPATRPPSRSLAQVKITTRKLPNDCALRATAPIGPRGGEVLTA